ncbi:MAG: contractile injection system tape measure protein [Candidatus Electrothrix aestuarii]|uniref:Contractile injection system tape measure protein n=1 Tax=Candidatus Electrothrix aestuarii TaxID=3062594 RepID=A0AAU8LW88_9BACT|nr:contractile injection system tape measure protein [Candidatus Electrothrix aestuarii]
MKNKSVPFSTHLIHTQTFNIHFSDQEQAEIEQDNGLTDFIKDRLLQIVDEVFSDCCPDQTIISLDTLELDLGTIPSQGYRDEMEHRLRRELTKLLKNKINQLPKTAQGGERKLTAHQGRLEVIRYFLANGHLPWTVASEADPLESRLRNLLDESPDALLSLLTSLQGPDTALRRLVQQFPPDLVKRIQNLAAAGTTGQQRKLTQRVKELSEVAKIDISSSNEKEQRFLRLLQQALFANRLDPLRRNWLELLRKQPQRLHEEIIKHGQQLEVRRHIARTFPDPMFADLLRLLEPSEHAFLEEVVFRPTLPPRTEEGASNDATEEKQRLLEFTLTYLLTKRGSHFNKKAYLTSVLHRMAAHDNVETSSVLQSISTALAAIPSQSKVQQEILQLLREIQESEDLGANSAVSPQQVQESQEKGAHKKNEESLFRTLLYKAFYEHFPARLRQQWQQLLKSHPHLLLQELRRHGQAAAVRHRIALKFNDSMFADLLHLLEPTQSDFLAEVVFHSALTSRKEQEPAGHDQRVREFTLAYLLTERGSQFNKNSYLASLLTRMAAHDNLDFTELVFSLHSTLSSSRQHGTPIQKEILHFLSELQSDEGDHLLAPNQEEISLLRRQEKYEWLAERLSGKKGLSTEDVALFSRLLQELLTLHPALLQRLFEECSDTGLGRFFTKAPLEALPALSAAFIGLTTRKQEGRGAEFLHAAEHFAGQAKSSRTYYRLLVEKLRTKEAIDFEEIITADQPKVDRRVEEKQQPEQQDSSGTPSDSGTSTTPHPALTRLLILLRQRGVHRELIRATERNATRAGDLDAFCELILACLEHDLPIDFEEIIEQSKKEKGQVKEPPASAPPDEDRESQAAQQEPEAISLPPALAGIGSGVRLSQAEKQLIRLLYQKHLNQAQERELAELIRDLLDKSPARLRFLLESGLAARAEQAERLAAILPESQMSRIFLLLRPRDFLRIHQQAEQLALACSTGPFGVSTAKIQGLKRQFLSSYVLLPSLGQKDFLLAFLEFLQIHLNTSGRRNFLRDMQQAVLEQEGQPEQRKELTSILAKELGKSQPTASMDTDHGNDIGMLEEKPPHHPPVNQPETPPEEAFTEGIYLENSGMVLVATYLPRLFTMLGLLEKSEFTDSEAAERAVHLLQYLVEERCDRPEYLLVLNKILCGLEPDQPLVREITMSDTERQTIDGLLAAVIQHWGALGRTSVAGLREAFLQRGGTVRLQDDAWHLEVEEKAYDMLLDRLPWSYSLIKLPWMKRALHVQWR